MALHGGSSAKRTVVYANIPEVAMLDLGKLTNAEKEERTTIKTVRSLNARFWYGITYVLFYHQILVLAWGKYIDGKGRKRFNGTAALSSSQCHVWIYEQTFLKRCDFKMVSYYWPRQYPRGFGKAVLRAFETHLANSPGRRDLRFKPELDLSSSVAQFWRLPMNDTWEDADLLGPFTYLMTSSKVRNGCCPNCKHVFLRVVFIHMHDPITWIQWNVSLQDSWCLASAHVGFLQGVQK